MIVGSQPLLSYKSEYVTKKDNEKKHVKQNAEMKKEDGGEREREREREGESDQKKGKEKERTKKKSF